MSYSLAIINGDFDSSTGVLSRVTGIDKLTQDLTLWLRSPIKSDLNHPLYGSILDGYIGSIMNRAALHEVKSEVNRVLNAYQQIQLAAMKDNPSKFEMDELLDSVEDIKVAVDYDSVLVYVKFRTASQKLGVVSGSVSL